MLARRAITSLKFTKSGGSRVSSFNTTSASNSINDINGDEPDRPVRKLKEWRKKPAVEDSFLKGLEWPKSGKPKPRRFIRRPVNLQPQDIREWVERKTTNYHKYDQRFVVERHQALGCNLAAAHFLVFRGGRVKIYGQDEWKVRNDDLSYNMPTTYDPAWQITHLDAGGVDLYYEAMENFQGLNRLQWASFKGNRHFDDWCLDRIAAQFVNVQHLDVSDCPSLTERGMEALYKSEHLKKLIITDWTKLPSFELTCVMLEDCIPDLSIEILDPPAEVEEKKKKTWF